MKKVYSIIATMLMAATASASVTLPATGNPITQTPEGEQVTYRRSSTAAMLYYSVMLLTGYEDYMVGDVVFAPNGDVYFKDMISEFDVDGWLKGTLRGDTITMELPQPILNYYGDVYYAFKMDCITDDTGALSDASASDDQTVKFLYKDGTITQVGDSTELYSHMIGLCTENAEWTWYGDMAYSYQPFTDSLTTLPQGLTAEEYALTTESDGHFVKMARDAGNAYIQGLSEHYPEAWVKLTVQPNGDLTLPGAQYVGTEQKHFCYIYPGTYEIQYTFGSAYTYDVTLQDEWTLTYDETDGSYSMPDTCCIVVNGRKDMRTIYDYYISPSMRTQPDVTEATPANPVIQDVKADAMAGSGTNYILCSIPCTDTRGYLLDKNRLSYELYFDGEPFTFYQDDYTRFPDEEMTRVPYSFTDSWDLSCSGAYHQIYLYVDGFDEVGVRSFYDSANGETYTSDLVTYSVNDSAIEEVNAESNSAGTQLYDLTGRRAAANSRGVMIQRRVMDNGAVKVSKIMR